jgi:excisionase family DNA binding protein
MSEVTEEVGRLLSISEVAYLLNLGDSTVRQWIREGRIASIKLGARRLVAMSEVIRLKESGRQPIPTDSLKEEIEVPPVAA